MSTPNTAMAHALADAQRRIDKEQKPAYDGKREFYWHYIKDHPLVTVRQMQKALRGEKHNENGIRLGVGAMIASGAVQETTHVDPAIDRLLRVNPRYKSYKEAYASGELVRINAPKKPKAEPKPEPAKAEQPDVAPVKVFDLEDMSIREARQLYEQLKKMFGDSK